MLIELHPGIENIFGFDQPNTELQTNLLLKFCSTALISGKYIN